VIRGTAALAASIICLTLVAMASSSLPAFGPVSRGCAPQPRDDGTISHLAWRRRGVEKPRG